MRVAISGASGFIGTRLLSRLSAGGHQIQTLGRRRVGAYPFFQWNLVAGEPPEDALANLDAVIHLAGEPIAQRWTPEVKQKIVDSRIKGTRHLVQALSTQPKRPEVLICSSAIGYYGSRGDEALDENSTPGSGFLPATCVEWENAAQMAESLGIRVIRLRTGIVLGVEGGALPKMLPLFRMGLGGRLGNGRQWMSWIHLDDLVNLIEFGMSRTRLSGAVNGVSPEPQRNEEFARQLAAVLRRSAWLPAPAFALKAVMGEMAEVVLGSQRVLPRKALETQFSFQFNHLSDALRSLMR